MTIEEKLVKIAENQQKVFEAGKAQGGGGDSYYDVFWDALQNKGNRKVYNSAFTEQGWDDETFKPKYSIRPQSANNMFAECNITNLKALLERYGVELDFSGITYNALSQVFANSSITDLGVLDVSTSASLGYFLWYAKKLVNAEKIILSDDGNTTFPTTTFQSCGALVEIRFEGVIGKDFDIHWSKSLSAESYHSIITHSSKNASFTLTLPPEETVRSVYDTKHGSGAWDTITAEYSNLTIAYM